MEWPFYLALSSDGKIGMQFLSIFRVLSIMLCIEAK